MYEYLTGTITVVTPSYIVIDVSGVGYQVQVANPYHYAEGQKQVRVYVYQSVSQDRLELFGFVSPSEKALFLKLISISGIGPKSALAILANPDHQGLIDAIANNDVAYLTKFPKVGKKTASRIIIELQDKLDTLTGDSSQVSLDISSQPLASDDPQLNDALAALKALGYAERDVNKVKRQLVKEKDLTTDQYLRHGLTLLSNNWGELGWVKNTIWCLTSQPIAKKNKMN